MTREWWARPAPWWNGIVLAGLLAFAVGVSATAGVLWLRAEHARALTAQHAAQHAPRASAV